MTERSTLRERVRRVVSVLSGDGRAEEREAAPREPGAAGISNRPVDREARRQAGLPPRGTARGETEPALAPRPDEHPAPRDPASRPRDPGTPRSGSA